MPTEIKVTYLLGAGASYNALPLVKEMHSQIEKMIEYIEGYDKSFGKETKLTKTSEIVKILKDHYSIDTLARKFKLKNDTEKYRRVKNIIACLIIFMQAEKDPRTFSIPVVGLKKQKKHLRIFTKQDNRYDAFLAAFLDEKWYLPQNINIISWNYDFQFEQALSYYSGKNLFRTAQHYNIISTANTAPLKLGAGTIIKINGTALLRKKQTIIDYSIYNNQLHALFIKALRDIPSPDVSSNINFSWEKGPFGSKTKNTAKEKLKATDILVVIGYSFPIFNRQVDIDLFSEFKGKVYLQDIPERAEQIKNQLDALQPGLSTRCEIQTDCEQFFVPNEYWSLKYDDGTI